MNDREAIEAAFSAWNDEGIDRFLEYLAPDVEWYAPPEFPEAGLYDRDSLATSMREQFDSVFTGSRVETLEVLEGPKGWLIAARQSGAHSSGVNFDWLVYCVVQLEDDLATRVWVFFDREAAVRQAGIDG